MRGNGRTIVIESSLHVGSDKGTRVVWVPQTMTFRVSFRPAMQKEFPHLSNRDRGIGLEHNLLGTCRSGWQWAGNVAQLAECLPSSRREALGLIPSTT